MEQTKQKRKRKYSYIKYAIIGAFAGLVWLGNAPFASAYTYFNPSSYQIFAPDVTYGESITEPTQAQHTSTTITSENTSYVISRNFNFYDENFYPIISSIYSTNNGYMTVCGPEYNNIAINCLQHIVSGGVGNIINVSTYFNDDYVFIGTGYNTPKILFFRVFNGVITEIFTPDYATLVNATTVTEPPINYEDCGTTDLACYMRNAFKWAFTVPASTFDKFLELKDLLQNKAPFGYGTSAYNAIGQINNTTDGAFTLEEVTPITDLIFTPIRLAFTWFLYFLFLFAIVKRFKHIQL